MYAAGMEKRIDRAQPGKNGGVAKTDRKEGKTGNDERGTGVIYGICQRKLFI